MLSSGERSFLCPEAPAGKLEPDTMVKLKLVQGQAEGEKLPA